MEAKMDDCDCQMVTTEQLKLLLESDQPGEKERAAGYLVQLLTSTKKKERERGYELFEESINHVLFCSCLNYRSLTGGFTHPLLGVLARTVESWATRSETIKAGDSTLTRSARP
jgi:hypothetical protein